MIKELIKIPRGASSWKDKLSRLTEVVGRYS